MATKIDFSGLSDVIPLAVQDMGELVKSNALEYGDLNNMVSIISDVSVAKKIGFLGALTALGKTSATTGCTYNTINGSISTTEKSWDPTSYDTKMVLCENDIEGTIAELSVKKGVDRMDLTGTAYMDLFEEALDIAIGKMMWRIIWMSDTDAANVSDSPEGYITDGVDLDYVNMIDGLFKRAYTIIAATPAQRVTIAANSEATYALQDSALTPALALTYAKNIYYNAPLSMRTKMVRDGFTAYCTQSFFDKLTQNFQSFELETMRTDLENGLFSIKINGIPFVPVPEWDEMIETYEDNGVSHRNPHRVLCYAKSNALVGVPSTSTWGTWKSIFSEETDSVYIKIRDMIDALFLHDDLVMVAI